MTAIVRASAEHLEIVLNLVDRLLAELSNNPADAVNRGVVTPQLIGAPDRFAAFLAFDDRGTAVGVVTVTNAVAAYAGGCYGIISELYVDPAHRSGGIGRQLLDAARAEAKARGWTRLEVTAPPDSRWDRTFAFYQRNGFVFTGRKLKYLVR